MSFPGRAGVKKNSNWMSPRPVSRVSPAAGMLSKGAIMRPTTIQSFDTGNGNTGWTLRL
jgi:hypothetical protein